MKSILLSLAVWALPIALTFAADEPIVAIDMETASQDPDFLIQGEYVTAETAEQSATAQMAKGVQVVALGNGQFRVVVYDGGLPGAGWTRKPPQVFAEEETDVVLELLQSLKVNRVQRKSPTLGKEPPSGAIVLFDGTQKSLDDHWRPGAKLSDDGLLMQGAMTKDTFQDFVAHLEFMTPYMPQARGQGRGNSGVYYQGRYETQVLDSFGLAGKNNETGGIYEIRDPDLNLCFPPLSWQTYDVEFTAARWDEQGNKVSNAILTVRLNGVVVQRDVEIPRITRAAPVQETPEPGPLYLQNHGNPVRFRNIWVLPRDADQEARRPRIPGFERFFAADAESPSGGELLIGELGCLNCHSGELPFVETKQAPVLSQVGSRVRPDWLMNFIADPHKTKPGTTMPNLFEGWTDDKRNEAVLALANFLAATGSVANQSPNVQAAQNGRQLFHSLGCVACHAPIEGPNVAAATTVPLADLKMKYTVGSLAEFLRNPHSIRPSGRMPSFNLSEKEADELAHFLAGRGPSGGTPNVRYQAYHGSWESLPDFASLEPVASGECAGFDLTVAHRNDQFGAVFEGFFLVETAGDHRFRLGSDDGSALFINGERLISNDGIHPHTFKETTVTLSAGVHRVRVEYFEQGGEQSLTLDAQGPAGPPFDLAAKLTLHADGSPVEATDKEQPDDGTLVFRRQEELIPKGQELFVSLGCANCHQMDADGSRLNAAPSIEFAQLRPQHGCLEAASTRKKEPNLAVPQYDLSPAQRRAVTAVLNNEAASSVDAQTTIHTTLARFNCYACHSRDNVGGPEFDRNPLFQTNEPEMGDEGRIPPPLDGVGDKLNDGWLNHLLAHGANDRPYMLTRMPNFGARNVGHLAQLIIQHDRIDAAELAEFDQPVHRVKAIGRQLVGDQGLACIKCHTFGAHRATGIQAISLTGMSRRIRADWFLRYLFEPARFRPGTRMPTGFPNGQAVVRDQLEGDPQQQISAIWTYLTDGDKAGIPEGLIAKMIELKPVDEPIIYRNFIEGTSPRGIAVGYPELAHLAWDANELCLRLIWHDRFIDASKHWVGRGPGKQVPLGDHQLTVEPTLPLAVLESLEHPWPIESVRKREGFQFHGYQLNDSGQPSFRYSTPFAAIHDFPRPVAVSERDAYFERTLTISEIDSSNGPVYFRAAVGRTIEPVEAGYRVNDSMTIQVEAEAEPIVREINGQQELLVPVTSPTDRTKSTRIVQRIIW